MGEQQAKPATSRYKVLNATQKGGPDFRKPLLTLLYHMATFLAKPCQ